MSLTEDRKWIARQKLDEAYQETHKTLQETLQIGRGTLSELQVQEETLQTVEDTIESTDYTVERSLKVLRGMTWSGMFYNAFTFQSGNDSVSRQVSSKTLENKSRVANSSSSKYNKSETIHSGGSVNLSKSISYGNDHDHDEEQILQISRAVDELYHIGVASGQALDSQKSTVDRINTKTEIVIDKTLEATLKSSRITSRRARADFVGRFQFIDLKSSHFLSVQDDDCLHLTNRCDRSSSFDVFIKETSVLGIQSVKTLLYIGITILGSVKVSGEYFGRYEESYINIAGKPTGILLLSRNWGSGGWLKQPKEKDVDELISETTSSIYDKENMILFHAQPVAIENHSNS